VTANKPSVGLHTGIKEAFVPPHRKHVKYLVLESSVFFLGLHAHSLIPQLQTVSAINLGNWLKKLVQEP
jgi:hypothetical protein